MSRTVLDSSAVLASFYGEAGADSIDEIIRESVISTVHAIDGGEGLVGKRSKIGLRKRSFYVLFIRKLNQGATMKNAILPEKAKLIWNRACTGEVISIMPGDLALTEMLLFHNYTMNGGVLHAAESLDAEALTGAADGYQYFGFDGLTGLIDQAKSIIDSGTDWEPSEAALNERYNALISDDAALFESLVAVLGRKPSEFSS